ncbi:hypothetical protein [Streptomyces boninensis]|uniref:hypothetical protein n=1 Tax=Streptomyces boninensis TaxID=2039455 RepID=UPI003B213D1E
MLIATRRAILLLWAAGGLTTACAIHRRPPHPDPGNKRLHRLASEPILTALPPAAKRTAREEKPATYSKGSIFEAGAWSGGHVTATFTSTLSVRDVYHFYAELADNSGWKPWQKLAKGFTATWVKHIASARQSYIRLDPDGFSTHTVDLTASGTIRSYRLTGSL